MVTVSVAMLVDVEVGVDEDNKVVDRTVATLVEVIRVVAAAGIVVTTPVAAPDTAVVLVNPVPKALLSTVKAFMEFVDVNTTSVVAAVARSVVTAEAVENDVVTATENDVLTATETAVETDAETAVVTAVGVLVSVQPNKAQERTVNALIDVAATIVPVNVATSVVMLESVSATAAVVEYVTVFTAVAVTVPTRAVYAELSISEVTVFKALTRTEYALRESVYVVWTG